MNSYIGFIYMSGLVFSPRSFMYCHGAILSISQFQAMFALLGTIYGGDGRTTFQLPDMRGRIPVGSGAGPGLPNYPLGARGGAEFVTLNQTNLPSHNHSAVTVAQNGSSTMSGSLEIAPGANNQDGTLNTPTNASHAVIPNVGKSAISAYATSANDSLGSHESTVSGTVALNLPARDVQVNDTGGARSHENRQPYTVVDYVICSNGNFPPRN